MEKEKSVDEQVMDIFDTEYFEMRQRIYEQVEDLWEENGLGEFDGNLNEYVCYYTDLISSQLKKSGIFPKELELFNPIPH